MKIVSLDFGSGRTGNYMMVFQDGNLAQSVWLPSDYAMKEIVEVVLDECTAPENIIICGVRGMDMSFHDNLPDELPPRISIKHSRRPEEYVEYFTNNKYLKMLLRILGYSNHMPAILKRECDKAIDEYCNIEICVGANSVARLSKKDRDMDSARMYCLLNAFDVMLGRV